MTQQGFWVLGFMAFPIPTQQGVCHTMALPFTLKKHLKAKEEL
jgi:hypothetical protein